MDDNRKKILIIEDNTQLLSVYKLKFESEGYEVIDAVTGKEGLTRAKENPPDIILLDIMLPGGMNGFDVMQHIKASEQLKNIKILLLTNLDSERDTGLSLGASDYIVKANTSIDELVGKVKSLLSK